MGERKVMNKYYAPDFDPAKMSKHGQPTNKQIRVRNMLPMGVRCSTCGNYMSEGTKINTLKEVVNGETYLGIKIYRFYVKCSNCKAKFVVKTDPQNSGYVVEAGAIATRNFDVKRAKRQRDFEEYGDGMKSLEKRALVSKRELDIMGALDEIKSIKSRHALVSIDAMLDAMHTYHHTHTHTHTHHDEKDDEKDEAYIKSIFERRKQDFVDEDFEDDGDCVKKRKVCKTKGKVSNKVNCNAPPSVSFMVKTKKKALVKNEESSGLLSLLQYEQHGDDDM